MPIYQGVDGINRQIKQIYQGVGGVNRSIKEKWQGVGGVNRKIFPSQHNFIISESSVGTGLIELPVVVTDISPVKIFMRPTGSEARRAGIKYNGTHPYYGKTLKIDWKLDRGVSSFINLYVNGSFRVSHQSSFARTMASFAINSYADLNITVEKVSGGSSANWADYTIYGLYVDDVRIL